MDYQTSRYKYIGPGMLVPRKAGGYVRLSKGMLVCAEVNTNVATVIAIVRNEWDWLVEPTYIAARYLEPIKHGIIDFTEGIYLKHQCIWPDTSGIVKALERAMEKGSSCYMPQRLIDCISKDRDELLRNISDDTQKKLAERYARTSVPFKDENDSAGFNAVLRQMSDIHAAKNHDYGNSFSDLFKECGMTYAYGHLKEKVNRIHALMDGSQRVKEESMLDSLYDLANYAVMTIVELLNKKDELDKD